MDIQKAVGAWAAHGLRLYQCQVSLRRHADRRQRHTHPQNAHCVGTADGVHVLQDTHIYRQVTTSTMYMWGVYHARQKRVNRLRSATCSDVG